MPWPPPKGWQKALLTGRKIPRRKRSAKQAKAIARRYEAQRKADVKRKAEADHRNFDREAGKGL
ncbi:hypothetical protein [Sulfitobacter donghicola]|uniref:hypothetical protein n=1 Tax=Sulfitobacter donghicola TaxID=421000 RepID=UPI00138DE166|nr:hypothetical protein [Sulfitobacter donghicola]